MYGRLFWPKLFFLSFVAFLIMLGIYVLANGLADYFDADRLRDVQEIEADSVIEIFVYEDEDSIADFRITVENVNAIQHLEDGTVSLLVDGSVFFTQPVESTVDFTTREDVPCPLPTVISWADQERQAKWARVRSYCDYIMQAAERNSLDPYLIAALIWWESGGDSEAISQSGAVGLMQVMPCDGLAAAYMCQNGPCFSDRPTIQQLLDPELNINTGSEILVDYINEYGSLRDGLKHYGPPEADYNEYADAILDLSERIEEIAFEEFGN